MMETDLESVSSSIRLFLSIWVDRSSSLVESLHSRTPPKLFVRSPWLLYGPMYIEECAP